MFEHYNAYTIEIPEYYTPKTIYIVSTNLKEVFSRTL